MLEIKRFRCHEVEIANKNQTEYVWALTTTSLPSSHTTTSLFIMYNRGCTECLSHTPSSGFGLGWGGGGKLFGCQ